MEERRLVVEAAARVLDDHDLSYWSHRGTVAHCVCGAVCAAGHGAHLAQVLADAGLLTPAVPA